MYIDVPAKVIEGQVNTLNSHALWPYNNGSDPYWSGGSFPKYYRWVLQMDIVSQSHSDYRTRRPYFYDGMDVEVGDYVADKNNGVAVKIIEVTEKTSHSVTCIVEDILRYNTFRDVSRSGNGIFSAPTQVIVFRLNEEGQPVVDPAPSGGLGQNFYNNLSSRFQNFESNYNFILNKTGHGFSIGDLIAADSNNNTFVLADINHPYLIGTVSNVDLGPDEFMINPFQKVIDGYSSLIGDLGSIIYAGDSGNYSLSGNHPIMIKLRQQTNTIVVGSTISANTITDIGSIFNLNNNKITIGGGGSSSDMVDSINSANAGITATLIHDDTNNSTDLALLNNFSAVFVQLPASAEINGVTINFSNTTSGTNTLGVGYADKNDIAADINAANIANISAFANKDGITLVASSGDITITNIGVDAAGNSFAGNSSSTGLALYVPVSTSYRIKLVAHDARAINLYDVNGSATLDFGLFSAENGRKAAALYIEQGVRQAATYVVANIDARNSLSVMFGDQAYVQDHGNGEWGFYIYTLDNTWIKLADQDSSQTDAQSIEVTITPSSSSSELIHTISNNRRVTFVTVSVTEPFNAAATVSVGDYSNNSRLMTIDQNDLTVSGDYSTTPSYVYEFGTDVPIKLYFNSNGATIGAATVAITYT